MTEAVAFLMALALGWIVGDAALFLRREWKARRR